MKTANEKLFDSLIKHQTYLIRYAGSIRLRMLELLRDADEKTIALAANALSGMTGIESAGQWRKIERVLKQIEVERRAAWVNANRYMQSELKRLSRNEIDYTIKQIGSALPVEVNLKRPKLESIDSKRSRPVFGRTETAWGTKLKNDDLNRVRSAVVSSASQNTPVKQALKAAFKTTESQAKTITKTLVNNTATVSRMETMGVNDEISQEQFLAVLDDRTTLICADNDGNLYVKGRGPIPPLHFGCRSIRIGVLGRAMLRDRPLKPQTEEQLVKEYADKNNLGNITKRSDLPFGHKGKFDEFAPQRVSGLIGGPAERISYNDWLKGQDKEFIVDTLGPTRASLFMRGDLELGSFVNRSGDSLTLEEITRRYGGL